MTKKNMPTQIDIDYEAKIEKIVCRIIDSIDDKDFLDLAKFTAAHAEKNDKLVEHIWTIKQAADDLNRPKEPHSDERLDQLFELLQGTIPALTGLLPAMMQEVAKP